ncbi:MAG: type II secretion system minor pseudopilin GspI [Gammaproteobacteria bacterium]|nr:type II secretion system minor pseudopilin GspI [Gammaproteobacteria bacterium]MCP5200328.1 type II secretion system minor pseudopilin GspI [Gammaproteobacteria bacterium]
MSGRPQGGFTLLEVMAALAVVAFAVAALWRGLAQGTALTQALPERTAARWVAQNRLALREAAGGWPSTRTANGTEQIDGRVWYWREIIEQSEEALLRRVTVEVRAAADGAPLFALSGYLARPHSAQDED